MEIGYTSFLIHCVSDYWLSQNDYIATHKKENFLLALLHAFLYTIPFVILTRSVLALFVIFITHALIDGTHIVEKLNQIKNWNFYTSTGYDDDRPIWISVWLLIFQDNILHLVINYLAILYL